MVMILDIDWGCPDQQTWDRGNELVDQLVKLYGLTENSAGTGFSRRDMQLELPDDIFSRITLGWDDLEEQLNDGDISQLPSFQWQVYNDEEDQD